MKDSDPRVNAAMVFPRPERISATAAPLPPVEECYRDGCGRPVYADSFACKKHRDELWYRMQRGAL